MVREETVSKETSGGIGGVKGRGISHGARVFLLRMLLYIGLQKSLKFRGGVHTWGLSGDFRGKKRENRAFLFGQECYNQYHRLVGYIIPRE